MGYGELGGALSFSPFPVSIFRIASYRQKRLFLSVSILLSKKRAELVGGGLTLISRDPPEIAEHPPSIKLIQECLNFGTFLVDQTAAWK